MFVIFYFLLLKYIRIIKIVGVLFIIVLKVLRTIRSHCLTSSDAQKSFPLRRDLYNCHIWFCWRYLLLENRLSWQHWHFCSEVNIAISVPWAKPCKWNQCETYNQESPWWELHMVMLTWRDQLRLSAAIHLVTNNITKSDLVQDWLSSLPTLLSASSCC